MGPSFFHGSGRPVDRAILEAAVGGAQEAWDAVVDHYASAVWAAARRRHLSALAAADVSRLTWMRLLDRLHVISPEALGSWLEQTAEQESTRLVRLSENRAEGQRPTRVS